MLIFSHTYSYSIIKFSSQSRTYTISTALTFQPFDTSHPILLPWSSQLALSIQSSFACVLPETNLGCLCDSVFGVLSWRPGRVGDLDVSAMISSDASRGPFLKNLPLRKAAGDSPHFLFIEIMIWVPGSFCSESVLHWICWSLGYLSVTLWFPLPSDL